jgi:hypothetical protein
MRFGASQYLYDHERGADVARITGHLGSVVSEGMLPQLRALVNYHQQQNFGRNSISDVLANRSSMDTAMSLFRRSSCNRAEDTALCN